MHSTVQEKDQKDTYIHDVYSEECTFYFYNYCNFIYFSTLLAIITPWKQNSYIVKKGEICLISERKYMINWLW